MSEKAIAPAFRLKPTIYDLMVIGLMAASATALKPILAGLVHALKASLNIPGGAIIGGIYFLPLIVGKGVSRFGFTGFFIGLTQAILMITTGAYGANGVLSLVSFSLPGLMIDVIYYTIKHELWRAVIATALANATGLTLVMILLGKYPLNLFVILLGAGILGSAFMGIFNYGISKQINRILKELHLKI
ncbi:hypothetical protein KAR04_08545 [Candidatus Calescamantes bacterium]|nr:hypothetical protein [Candidatus Calescamantes bacterium]